MPYIKKHIDAGFITSFIVSSLLFVGYAKGIVPTLHDLSVLVLFGWIGIVIGSDLPDIDSRTAPVHSIFELCPYAMIAYSTHDRYNNVIH